MGNTSSTAETATVVNKYRDDISKIDSQDDRIKQLPEWAQNVITRSKNDLLNEKHLRSYEISSLKNALTNSRSSSFKLEENLSKAKVQIVGQNKKINQLIKENSSYAKQIKDLEQSLADVNDEADELADEVEELEQELSKAKSQESSQSRKINQLMNENASYANQIKNLKKPSVPTNVKSQISGQTRKIHQLISENASYAKQIKDLKSQLTITAPTVNTNATKKKRIRTRRGRKKKVKEIKAAESKTAEPMNFVHAESKSKVQSGDRDSFECKICELKQGTINRILFTPCGHGSCCKCGNQITNCHICKTKIIERIKQFE